MTELVTTKKKAENLQGLIEKYRPQLDRMLPDQIGVDRFLQIVLSQVRAIPKLLECSPQSFIGATMEAVKLNLLPGVAGQAWIIPYKKEATFIAGYRGLVQLAWRSQMIASIYADVVREKDEFDFDNFPRRLHHKAYPGEDGGRMIAAYAFASFKGGGEQLTLMRDWEVLRIKKNSPAAASNFSPWNKDEYEPEMWKKTVLRRHCKVLPMSIEFERIATLDEQAELGHPQGLEIDLENIPEADIQGEGK